MIRSALQATDWKSRYGIAVQVGIEGFVDDLNSIAKWLYETRDTEITVIDNVEHIGGSFLDGLKSQVGAHYHVPATMQGNVRLYDEAPVLHAPILFLHAASSNRADIEPIIDGIEPGTIILGSVDACRMVLDAAQCKAQPLYFHGQDVSLRVVV